VTSIGFSAFNGSSLTSITIGANVFFDIVSTHNNLTTHFGGSYIYGGCLAGTYTRPNTSSNVWSMQ